MFSLDHPDLVVLAKLQLPLPLPRAMEVEILPSPVDNSTIIHVSQGNVTVIGRTFVAGGYDDTTVIRDQTVMGGIIPGPDASPV